MKWLRSWLGLDPVGVTRYRYALSDDPKDLQALMLATGCKLHRCAQKNPKSVSPSMRKLAQRAATIDIRLHTAKLAKISE